MPRVVPSQVVEAIDVVFPTAARGEDLGGIGFIYGGKLLGLVRLVEEVPAELLTVSGSDYSTLISMKELIKFRVQMWISRGGSDNLTGSAVSELRRIMKLCPDEAPSPTTASLSFVTSVDLRNSIRLDVSSAFAGLHSGEWKTATVLAGSAIEALLLWAIEEKQAAGAGLPASAPTKPLGRWDLSDYVTVSADMGLIETQVKSLTDLVRDFRNLIHPGRVRRTAMKCSRATALAALSGLEFVVADLQKAFP